MSLATEGIRSKAEVHHGSEVCQERSRFLLGEMGLPSGLLPLKEVEECGYVPETGFVWLKQKKKTVHKFEKIGKLVSYETEVTAYVEKNRMRKLTGVKSKEILIWVSLTDLSLDPATRKITFKSPTGLYRSFPAPAFDEEDLNATDKESEVEGKNAQVQEEAERGEEAKEEDETATAEEMEKYENAAVEVTEKKKKDEIVEALQAVEVKEEA